MVKKALPGASGEFVAVAFLSFCHGLDAVVRTIGLLLALRCR
jgi:hypothetical protein